MLTGAYRDLLPAIADCAAALTGLLFVAMTVARRHSPADRPVVIEQVRAAASILAFTNALAVSLFGRFWEDRGVVCAVPWAWTRSAAFVLSTMWPGWLASSAGYCGASGVLDGLVRLVRQ
jgi:hypothetical protein